MEVARSAPSKSLLFGKGKKSLMVLMQHHLYPVTLNAISWGTL